MSKKLPTSLRQYAESKVSEAKQNPTANIPVPGRPRVFSLKPGVIKVYIERNIRPIDQATVEQYAKVFLRGDAMPPIVIEMENGEPTLVHGYHRTLGALLAIEQNPELEELLHLEAREFVGNSTDRIALMLNSQDSLDIDPVSRARAYLTMRNQGLNNAQIAERVSRTPEHVAQLMRLNEASEKVKQLIRDGRIASTAVITLINEEKQGGKPHDVVIEGMLEVAKATGKKNATMKHRPKKAPAFDTKKVRNTLRDLHDITPSIRQALDAAKVGGDNEEAEVAITLPAGKLSMLLALLEKESEPAEAKAQPANEGLE